MNAIIPSPFFFCFYDFNKSKSTTGTPPKQPTNPFFYLVILFSIFCLFVYVLLFFLFYLFFLERGLFSFFLVPSFLVKLIIAESPISPPDPSATNIYTFSPSADGLEFITSRNCIAVLQFFIYLSTSPWSPSLEIFQPFSQFESIAMPPILSRLQSVLVALHRLCSAIIGRPRIGAAFVRQYSILFHRVFLCVKLYSLLIYSFI